MANEDAHAAEVLGTDQLGVHKFVLIDPRAQPSIDLCAFGNWGEVDRS
jgi:hypothetical protein